jgi:drug/metabolite transporter (DMT)-like permease
MTVVLILLSVLLGAVGQLFFKLAVEGRGSLGLIQALIVSMQSWYFWIGLVGYALSLALWMKILTDADLSYARPFASAGYIVTAILALIFLDESISLQRWIGIVITVVGVFLISRS